MFKAQAGVFMVHIPYAGGNPAQLALLSGQVDLTFDNLAAASANISAGKLSAIAVTTATRARARCPRCRRSPRAAAALGLARFDIDTWFGLFGPARLPRRRHARGSTARSSTRSQSPTSEGAAGATFMAEPLPIVARAVRRLREGRAREVRALVKASGARVE